MSSRRIASRFYQLKTDSGKDRFKIRDDSADERYSQEILDFHVSTEVGRRVPGPAGEDARRGVSEWGHGEREERAGEGEAGGGVTGSRAFGRREAMLGAREVPEHYTYLWVRARPGRSVGEPQRAACRLIEARP